MNDLLPSGYFDFENGLIDEYEDDLIKAVRNSDGTVTMNGKPIKFAIHSVQEEHE